MILIFFVDKIMLFGKFFMFLIYQLKMFPILLAF